MGVTPLECKIQASALRVTAQESAARANPLATSLLLLASDVSAIATALTMGIVLWRQINPAAMNLNYLGLWPVAALVILVYYFSGLYAPCGLNPPEELKRTTEGIGVVCMVLAAGIFLSKDVGYYSRGVFIVAGLLSSALVPSGRAALRKWMGAKSWWGAPVVILGQGKTAARIGETLRRQPWLGLKPVAFLDDELAMAPVLAASWNIRHAIVAVPNLDRDRLAAILQYASAYTYVIIIPDLFGIATLWVSTRDIGGVLGLEVRQNLLMPLNRCLKRFLDIVLASILGVLSLPIVIASAIAVRLASPGPLLYIHEREGAGSTRIRIPKLRTMYANAEELLTRHLAQSRAAQDEWKRYCKLRHDPRILPRIGHFLRRTSIDELPQLWSVLRGDMSLVGPRPFYKNHPFESDTAFRLLRAGVKPGLTGLWQVTSRSDGDIDVQKALDTYYIRNWSLWLDVHILARTIHAVLFGKGAY
jgi:Undecaprenyl-phosphate galactose phosphotransferase WbaP